ncbi:hypothetical protein [Raoultella ornithinolytica]|uniref:hypothetical protein n=1 Tax=Raoultella ornithinolytica TaxID=54291 RepID=UPI003D9652AF
MEFNTARVLPVFMVAICGGDAELMKQQQAARGMKIMYPELMYEKGQELKAGI